MSNHPFLEAIASRHRCCSTGCGGCVRELLELIHDYAQSHDRSEESLWQIVLCVDPITLVGTPGWSKALGQLVRWECREPGRLERVVNALVAMASTARDERLKLALADFLVWDALYRAIDRERSAPMRAGLLAFATRAALEAAVGENLCPELDSLVESLLIVRRERKWEAPELQALQPFVSNLSGRARDRLRSPRYNPWK